MGLAGGPTRTCRAARRGLVCLDVRPQRPVKGISRQGKGVPAMARRGLVCLDVRRCLWARVFPGGPTRTCRAARRAVREGLDRA